MIAEPVVINDFVAYTVGILVCFAGMWVNRRVAVRYDSISFPACSC